MLFKTGATFLALLPVLIAAAPRPVPPCGDKNVACRCPTGTTFGNYTTFVTIAASVNDVYAVTGDFYDSDWFGLPTTKTQGPDNKPGVSVRTLPVTAAGTTYDLVEKLTALTRNYRSFFWAFDQVNVGVQVPPEQGGGAFYGYWPSFDAKQRGYSYYKTDVAWNVYYCVVGNPFNFASFHEGALVNVSSILQQQGKLHGESTKPFSVKNF